MHYNEEYFKWQKSSGEFGAKADRFKFINHVNENLNVIDFGCGGAYLLASLPGKNKIGIEINESAKKQAKENGINVVSSINEIEDDWADIIISNHALEHCQNPLQELKNLYQKLKNGGKIIFVTPLEVYTSYSIDDINQHLYTWSPQNIGNLFTHAGFKVDESKIIKFRWPPYARHIYDKLGKLVFRIVAKIYSRWKGDLFEVITVAQK